MPRKPKAQSTDVPVVLDPIPKPKGKPQPYRGLLPLVADSYRLHPAGSMGRRDVNLHNRLGAVLRAEAWHPEIIAATEDKGFGFQDRHHIGVWSMILEALLLGGNETPKVLEIGVHCGLSLWTIKQIQPGARCFGIGPMADVGDSYNPSYGVAEPLAKLKELYALNGTELPILLHSLSQEPEALAFAQANGPFDLIYIDGSHDYADVIVDLASYAPMLAPGGYLVVDDACLDEPALTGFGDVTLATNEMLMDSSWVTFLCPIGQVKIFANGQSNRPLVTAAAGQQLRPHPPKL